MASEIIDSVWYGIKLPIFGMRIIGVVAMRCTVAGEVKYYIGLGRGKDTKEDEEFIAEWGVPVYPAYFASWVKMIEEGAEDGRKKDKTDEGAGDVDVA